MHWCWYSISHSKEVPIPTSWYPGAHTTGHWMPKPHSQDGGAPASWCSRCRCWSQVLIHSMPRVEPTGDACTQCWLVLNAGWYSMMDGVCIERGLPSLVWRTFSSFVCLWTNSHKFENRCTILLTMHLLLITWLYHCWIIAYIMNADKLTHLTGEATTDNSPIYQSKCPHNSITYHVPSFQIYRPLHTHTD